MLTSGGENSIDQILQLNLLKRVDGICYFVRGRRKGDVGNESRVFVTTHWLVVSLRLGSTETGQYPLGGY